MTEAPAKPSRPVWAWASAATGALFFVPFAGLLAVGLGLVALRRSPAQRGIAWVGLVLGVLTTAGWGYVAWAAWLRPVALEQELALYQVDVGTGERERVLDVPDRLETCPVWGADAHTFFFQAPDDTDRMRLWRVRDGGRPEALALGPGAHHRPEPSPDGRSLAFLRLLQDGVYLAVADLGSGTVRDVSEAARWMSAPRWSDDGEHLLVAVSARGEGPRLYRLDPKGTASAQRVSFRTSEGAPDRQDDPDWVGDTVAFHAGNDLWVADLSAGEATRLLAASVTGPMRIRGDSLFFVAHGASEGDGVGYPTRIYRTPLSGQGAPELVVEAGATLQCFDVSADGKTLFLAMPR